MEKSGTGGRARTMAGPAPTGLHYGSKPLPAAYRHPGSLGPHEPCRTGPWLTMNDTICESLVEAREEGRYSERRIDLDMEEIVTFCEETRRKRCHLRVPADEVYEEVTSCSSGSKAQRHRKRGSPKPFKEDGQSAMQMTPSPVRQKSSALWTPRDIILVILPMVPAQSQISSRGDHIPPQILRLAMMQTGKRYREGQQPQESQGIPSSV